MVSACIGSKIAKICRVHAGVPSSGVPFFASKRLGEIDQNMVVEYKLHREIRLLFFREIPEIFFL